MQVDTFRRVTEELRRVQRQLRAFEDASRAERARQVERQRTATGAPLREALKRADVLEGEIAALVQAHEIVAMQLAGLASTQRQALLMGRGRPR